MCFLCRWWRVSNLVPSRNNIEPIYHQIPRLVFQWVAPATTPGSPYGEEMKPIMTRSSESEERGNSPASCLEQCTGGDRNSDRNSLELRSTIWPNEICRKQLCNHWFIASLKCQTLKKACNLQVVNLGGPGSYSGWRRIPFLIRAMLVPWLVELWLEEDALPISCFRPAGSSASWTRTTRVEHELIPFLFHANLAPRLVEPGSYLVDDNTGLPPVFTLTITLKELWANKCVFFDV